MSQTVEALRSALERWLRSQKSIELDTDRLRMDYVPNRGGLVNASFRVSDTQRSFHIKTSIDPGYQKAFRRWDWLKGYLSENYRAPAVLGELELPEVDATGLVFEHIEGAPFDIMASSADLEDGIALVARLHQDKEIRRSLPSRWKTCFDVIYCSHLERFRENIALLKERPPNFVGPVLLEKLALEVARLEERLFHSIAFHQPANRPCHNDLWNGNFLHSHDGDWFVLDWDELELGDPALDYALLLSPPLDRWSRDAWRKYDTPHIDDPVLEERIEMLFRINLLDWVIEPLAELIEADEAFMLFEPQQKRLLHERALQLYLKTYLKTSVLK